MGKQRQTWTAQQKQALVLAALRGDQSIAELARHHGVRENLIYRWKSDFLEAGSQALGASKTPRPDVALKQENEQLKKLLGEKTLEIDVLKKWSSL
jgi:transposase